MSRSFIISSTPIMGAMRRNSALSAVLRNAGPRQGFPGLLGTNTDRIGSGVFGTLCASVWENGVKSKTSEEPVQGMYTDT